MTKKKTAREFFLTLSRNLKKWTRKKPIFTEVEITNARELTIRVYNPLYEKWEKKRILSDFYSLKDNFRFIQDKFGKKVQIIDFRESDISFIGNLPCSGLNILDLPIDGYEINSMVCYRMLPGNVKSSKFRFATVGFAGVNPTEQIKENAYIFFHVSKSDVRFESKIYRPEHFDAVFYMNEEKELDRDIKRYDGFVNEKNVKNLQIKFEHKSNF